MKTVELLCLLALMILHGQLTTGQCLGGGEQERTIYEHCARVDDTANNKSIYIASSTNFPVLLIEETGGNYTFDSDKTREHVNRIWVTSDPLLKTGDDYRCHYAGLTSLKYKLQNYASYAASYNCLFKKYRYRSSCVFTYMVYRNYGS